MQLQNLFWPITTLLGLVVFWQNPTKNDVLPAAEPVQALYDPLVAANQDDATLRSVCAVTAERVIAVGDRGLVLMTENGGTSWIRRFSGTTANLHSVEFFDNQRGWAVGGTIQAMSKTSLGVILATVDGGATWQVQSAGILPRLVGLTILANGRLVAYGDYSTQLKSSVFESFDGGAAWRGISLPMGHAQTLGWAQNGVGLVLDRLGSSCQVSGHLSIESGTVFEPTRPVYSVAHTGKHWLACGASAQLLTSVDGKVWHDIPLPISESARRVCQWYSIAQRDNRVWIAGYPGTLILRSSDYGETWEKLTHNFALPKYDLSFADERRGWAVGPGGSILASRDGGVTWFVQRSQWQRLAVQSIVSRTSNIPWPALVSVSWEDGRAVAGLVMHSENLEESSDFLPEQSTFTVDVAPQVGMADLQILPKYPIVNISSNDALGDDAELIGDLVIAICVWKPDVVMTENPAAKQGIERSAAQIVQRAIQLAAAPNVEQARIAGELNLAAWRVKKTVVKSENAAASFSFLRDQVLRDVGLSISDVLLPLGETASSENAEISMRTLDDQPTTGAAHSSLLGGVAPADDTRRRISLKNVGNYQFVMARVHREAAIKRFQQMKDQGPSPEDAWQSQLAFLLKSVPKREIGPTVIRIAEESSRRQQWHRWQAAMELLAEAAPTDDSTRWSQLQLLRFTASDELHAWRRRLKSEKPLSAESAVDSDYAVIQSVGRASWSETPFESSVIPASASQAMPLSAAVDAAHYDATIPSVSTVESAQGAYVADLRRSLERFRMVAATDSLLSSRPDQLLLQQSRHRRFCEMTGAPFDQASNLQLVAEQTKLAGWKQVAEQELLLLAGKTDALRWVAYAIRTELPPHLDGHLDEEFWQRAQPIELTSFGRLQSREASQLRLAHDDKYLYLSAVCPRTKLPGIGKPHSQRSYDMNLAGTDHVHLVIDTDRDYATAHELGINDRGETFDRTCGLAEWNPKWYVAVRETDELWCAEAAIELDDLTIMSSVGGRAWAMSALRSAPDTDTQSWSHVQSARPLLQASGLLLLEP